MNDNFWSRVANNTSCLLIGFITASEIYGHFNFWLLFLGEIVGIFVIWIICATLNALFGDKK